MRRGLVTGLIAHEQTTRLTGGYDYEYAIKVSLKKQIPNSKKYTASKVFSYSKVKNSITFLISKNINYYSKIRAYKVINRRKYYGK